MSREPHGAAVLRRRCPSCGDLDMNEVSARARTGYLLVLDQCPRCGGVWCDRWELFPLTREEAARIDPVDETALAAGGPIPPGPGRCPRCSIPLQHFQDPALPADSQIERCRLCEGLWLRRGQLHRVKRAGKGAGATPPVSSAALGAVAQRLGAQAGWARVEHLDAALHRPPPDDFDPEELRAGALWGVAQLVLWYLLRLVFRG